MNPPWPRIRCPRCGTTRHFTPEMPREYASGWWSRSMQIHMGYRPDFPVDETELFRREHERCR